MTTPARACRSAAARRTDLRDEALALTAHKLLNAVAVVHTCVELLSDQERDLAPEDRADLRNLALSKLDLIKSVLVRQIHGPAETRPASPLM